MKYNVQHLSLAPRCRSNRCRFRNTLLIVAVVLGVWTRQAEAQAAAYSVTIRFGSLNTDCYPSCDHPTEWLQALFADVVDSSGVPVAAEGVLFDWGVDFCGGLSLNYGWATGVGLNHIDVDGLLNKNIPGCCSTCPHTAYWVCVRVTVNDETVVGPLVLVPNIPRVHALRQNFPNPFNDRTRIPFELEEQAHVRLEILDLQGRMIACLTDRTFAPGRHAIDWTPHNTASGVYPCRITISPQRSSAKVFVGKMLFGK